MVYNPFFIAQTTVLYDFCNPEFVLIGENKKYLRSDSYAAPKASDVKLESVESWITSRSMFRLTIWFPPLETEQTPCVL